MRIPVEGGFTFERLWVGPDDFAEKAWFKKRISELRARYDIRPTQEILIIKQDAASHKVTLPPAVWGVNDQVYDKASGTRKPVNAINARQEKLLNWNVWRGALKHHRCVIPATAFYEWQEQKNRAKRLPWEIRRKGSDTFYFAGVCKPKEAAEQDAGAFEAAIITQPANNLLRWIHNHGGNKGRQPVFIDEDCLARWLDPELTDAAEAAALLRPIEDGEWEARPLAEIGNDTKHNPPVPLDNAGYVDAPLADEEIPAAPAPAARRKASRPKKKSGGQSEPGLFG